jgi:hypothetical protein
MGEALTLLPAPLASLRQSLREQGTSPIAAVNFWFHAPPFREKMVGFLDMDIQWAFNRETLWGPTAAGQLSVVISAAQNYEGLTSNEMIALALGDLRRAFPDFKEEPRHATVTWERHATPRPTPAFYRARPTVETPLENFFLAGDWVNVGLPPTIETACRSGHRAAALALCLFIEPNQGDCSVLKAIIFDCDGVIADSEHLHFALFKKVLEPEGIELTQADYVEKYLAMDDRGCFDAVFAAEENR